MTDTSVNYVTAPTSLSDNNTDSCENVPESTSDDSKTKASGAPKAVTSSSLSTSSSSALAVMDERLTTDVESVYPMKRHEVLKWYGWGYKDAEFFIKDETIWFRGENYPLHGKPLPLFTQWVMGTFKCLLHEGLHRPELPKNLPQPTINQEFLKDIKSSGITHSFDGVDRFMRCHGQTIRDIYNVNFNTFQRIPDIVTWPTCHDDVVVLVNMAHRCNVVIIPYGGGTSVSGAVTCPQNEERMICLLDTSQMNRMLWINKSNLTVCFEAGVVGQDLERTLRAQGVTVGHEPDSYEFSTLGGWVATRASGMKKNVYGNIEDLVVQVKMVTPSGVLERQCTAPRISCGPDFNHVIMGSEGMLGVVTEVVLKIRPLPKVTRYNSLVFATFESGVEFMREVAKRRCQPSSIRLMDNEQFILGQCLKPPKDWKGEIKDYISKKYVTLIKGIDLTQICAATLLFEGDQDEVSRHEELIISIAKKHKGFAGGSENGERGYILTFVIAYIRDLGFQHDIVAESFETSVPWDRCYRLCMNVKQRVVLECHARSVMHFSVSCRVTQTYDAGACVYFYFAFNFRGFDNPVDLYQQIEDAARDEIIDNGGSISHHHGVGKMRSPWYQQSVTKTGVELFQATKKRLDPNNIFALGNLLPTECQEEDAKSSLSSTKRGNVKVMSKL